MQKNFKSVLTIFIGITLTALGVSLFYIPNKIVTGGVSGIAAILFALGIPPGIVYFSINSVLVDEGYIRGVLPPTLLTKNGEQVADEILIAQDAVRQTTDMQIRPFRLIHRLL